MRSISTLTAVLALAGVASADSVDLAYIGSGRGSSHDIVANGTSARVFAGQLNFTVANGSGFIGDQLNGDLLTFCIDVLEPVGAFGVTNTYQIDDLADAPVTAAGGMPAMGQNKAEAIGRLYTFAAGQQFGSSNDFAAAFQLAIWEVIADFGGTMDITGGDFQVTSPITSGVQTILDDLLNAANNLSIQSFRGLGALTNEGLQDQLYAVVIPLPGAAGLAAVGLAGLVATRRRRF